MTVHARGYRAFSGVRRPRRMRFVPIAREGYRIATRSVLLLVFRLLFVLVPFVVLSLSLYFQSGPLQPVLKHMTTARTDEALARQALVGALLLYQVWTSFFVLLLAVFTGAGVVADDVRTRALPLYLVRPLSPFDYFLGKWLVPVLVLAGNVLLPGLLLVLLAASFRPPGHSLDFLMAQRDVVLAVLEHFGVLAMGYASLVLLVSALVRRRLTAIIVSALVFIAGVLLAGAAQGVTGPLGDAARACSLFDDALRVLQDSLGESLPSSARRELPTIEAALAVPGALFVACAMAVLRRARTTEVVS